MKAGDENGLASRVRERRARRQIVVTGGAGLIGSALVRQLNLDGDDDIIVVDRLGASEKWRHLVPLRFADYLEAEEFYRAHRSRSPTRSARSATVFHLGACSSTTERDASYLVANNVRRSQEIARWALARGARFVYASSAATYGARESDMREDLDPHSLRPLNMYGYSKHLFDLWMRREGLLDRVVGIKYFNVYGPNEDHKGDMRSVVAKAYEQIRATRRDRAVQELSRRDRRRRADARLPLRQRRGGDHRVPRAHAARPAGSTTSARASSAAGTTSRARCSPRSTCRRDRVHRDARRAARQVPVPHRRDDRPAARGRLDRSR